MKSKRFIAFGFSLISLMGLQIACNFPGQVSPTEPPPPPTLPLALPTDTELPTFEPPEVTSPAEEMTSTPTLLSISGVLWHEICEFSGGQAGEPLVLGVGCVQFGEEDWQFGPNQIYDAFETGWQGVTLHLGLGACPSTGLAAAITNAAGEYTFGALSAGTYCVSYDSLTDGNDSILIPGGPTYPIRAEAGFQRTVELLPDESQIDINFGYAFQFFD